MNTDIRYIFHSNSHTKELLIQIANGESDSQSSINLAYKGLCETLLAEYHFLPANKLKSFSNGKDKIEAACKADASNIEIRYIRMLVQLNAPSILDYNESIEEDLSFFFENIQRTQLENKWLKIFISNLLKSKKLKPDQVIRLIKLKEQIQ